ncbi:hypothetical protein [Streptomyces sp. NPDC051561]|uniref:hypothetical protein n=1 Tax=Streptomyces sp. NPDC051561 TaxID=3365658 RepID=UPI003787D6B2
MNAITKSRKPAGRRSAAVVLALALGLTVASAGSAAATPSASAAVSASAQGHAATAGVPNQVIERLCAGWEAVAEALPVPAAPAKLCKLVNGWD